MKVTKTEIAIRVFGLILFAIGFYIIVKELGWLPMLGIFLLKWSDGIDKAFAKINK